MHWFLMQNPAVPAQVACTGLHGANRLASNSLLEGLVFAARAVKPSVEHLAAVRSTAPLVSCPNVQDVPLDVSCSRCWCWALGRSVEGSACLWTQLMHLWPV
jgi:hypothetical protein